MLDWQTLRAQAVDLEAQPEPTLAELLRLPEDQQAALPDSLKRVLHAEYSQQLRAATAMHQAALERLLAH